MKMYKRILIEINLRNSLSIGLALGNKCFQVSEDPLKLNLQIYIKLFKKNYEQ